MGLFLRESASNCASSLDLTAFNLSKSSFEEGCEFFASFLANNFFLTELVDEVPPLERRFVFELSALGREEAEFLSKSNFSLEEASEALAASAASLSNLFFVLEKYLS